MVDLYELKRRSAVLSEEKNRVNDESYDVLCNALKAFYEKYGVKTIYFDDENYISPTIICRLYADDDVMKDCVVHSLNFDVIENESPFIESVDVRVVGEDGGYISGISVNEDCFNWDDNEFCGYIIDQIEKGRYVPENFEEV